MRYARNTLIVDALTSYNGVSQSFFNAVSTHLESNIAANDDNLPLDIEATDPNPKRITSET